MISQFPLNQSQAHATALISSFSHREPRCGENEEAREGGNEREDGGNQGKKWCLKER